MNWWRWLVVAAAVTVALCSVPLTGARGILPAVAAAGAVAALVVPRAALPAALLSLAVDAAHRGPPQPAGLWLPVEFLALAVLHVRVTRHATALRSAVVGLALTALPLRMTLNLPGERLEPSVLLVATAFACAVGTGGLGLYLRYGDNRRRRAAERARREQRLALARDLHDLVAHEVTGIVVQAQAAQLDGDPAALPQIEEAGLRALDAMDRLVKAMRGHGLQDLPGVVARFDATGPTRATLVMDPGVSLDAAAGTAAYHVVVEALTNVRRHAPGAGSVTVTLDRDGRLTVVDSGGGAPRRRRSGGGSGLAGLRERVPGLTAGPHGSGWRVTCDLSRSADVPEAARPDA